MRYVIIGSLVVLIAACGEDANESDTEEANGGGLSHPQVIPGEFSSTASSAAEVTKKLDEVSTSILESSATGLSLSASSGVTPTTSLWLQTSETDSETGSTTGGTGGSTFPTMQVPDFEESLEPGESCTDLMSSFNSQFANLNKQLTQAKDPTTLGSSASSSGTSSNTEELYQVEDLSSNGDKFTFHKRYTRKELDQEDEDNPFSAFFALLLPKTMEVAAGANDGQVAMNMSMQNSADLSKWKNESSSSQTTTSGGKFKMDTNVSYFLDRATKSLKYGSASKFVTKSDGSTMKMKAKSQVEMKGGDKPRMVADMRFNVLARGTTVKMKMHLELEKKSEDTLTATVKANGGNRSVNRTVTLDVSDQCVVASKEG